MTPPLGFLAAMEPPPTTLLRDTTVRDAGPVAVAMVVARRRTNIFTYLFIWLLGPRNEMGSKGGLPHVRKSKSLLLSTTNGLRTYVYMYTVLYRFDEK